MNVMKKERHVVIDGVDYYSMEGLAEAVGTSYWSLKKFQHKGAFYRVRTRLGLYYRLDEKWEIRNTRTLDIKEEYKDEASRHWEMVKKLGSLYGYKWYSATELMQMEGISTGEFYVRCRKGLYYKCRGEYFRYLTDAEFEKIYNYMPKKMKDRGWDKIKHGDDVAYADYILQNKKKDISLQGDNQKEDS